MLKRVDKLLIGKDINRDAQVVAGASITTVVGSTGLAEGEIVVFDKFKKVATPGITVADSDVIFICQGLGETYDYTNPQGTAVTSNRKVVFSDPIEGKKVRSYEAVSYTAKSEQTAAQDWAGYSPTAGDEIIVRVIYKDIKEHPGQFVQTYRVISSGTLATDGAAMAAKINAHSGRRINADYTTTTLTLTARAIPECTTGLTDIDEFSMVEFEMRSLYVDSNGNWQVITATDPSITYSGPTYGQGNWEQVRDIEKLQKGHLGVTNKTHFPVLDPGFATVKDAEYDLIVIEHDRTYLAPNNQGVEQTPITTVLAMETGTTTTGVNDGNQVTQVLSVLNPWMASTPGAFSNVSV